MRIALLFCTLSVASTFTVKAAQQAWQPVKPFQAKYKAYFKGIAVGHGQRTLKLLSPNNYQASSTATVLGGAGMSYKETSQFRYQGHKITSEGFSRKKKVLFGSTKIVGRPDRNGGLFISTNGKHKHVAAGKWGNTLDSSAFMVQFQTDVKNGQTTFHYHYVEGNKVKDYQFKIDGHEIIKVPAGEYKTIRLKRINKGDRETIMWLAPKLDYQLVKMQILRKGKRWSSMQLTHITLGK